MNSSVNRLPDMGRKRIATLGESSCALGEGSSSSLKREKTKPEQELGSPSGYYLRLPENCKSTKLNDTIRQNRKLGYGNLKRGNADFRMLIAELKNVFINNLKFITHNRPVCVHRMGRPQALRGLCYGK
jgi:hypothetical protein